MRQIAPHPVPCRIKNSPKYTLSHQNFAKIHCFKRPLKDVLPHDTLSHNFLINCKTLSHAFYQKKKACRIIFTVKGHPVERHIPSSQVWEYPPPPGTLAGLFLYSLSTILIRVVFVSIHLTAVHVISDERQTILQHPKHVSGSCPRVLLKLHNGASMLSYWYSVIPPEEHEPLCYSHNVGI